MGKIFYIILFCLASVGSYGTLSLLDFAKKNNYSVKYNLNLGYVEMSLSNSFVKLFINMPYLVSSGNIYYLKDKLQSGRSGDLEIPEATAELIQKTLSTSSQSSSSVMAIKDDWIEKKEYNTPQKDDFIPIDSIVLDPGHGGKDPGGLGVNGVKEKEIVLSISKKVYDLLRKDKKLKIAMTRNNDRYVTLKERTDRTSSLLRKKQNPLFISIHGNISLNRKTDGIEVYSLSDKASDEEALSVETVENAGFSKSDVEKTENLASIISDLLKDGLRKQSEELAKAIGKSVVKSTRAELRGVKKANFYVLKYNSLPAVLVEVGFLSHSGESKKLMDYTYQQKLANGIYQGIINFLESYNKSRGFTR